jgi:hypothetical protein
VSFALIESVEFEIADEQLQTVTKVDARVHGRKLNFAMNGRWEFKGNPTSHRLASDDPNDPAAIRIGAMRHSFRCFRCVAVRIDSRRDKYLCARFDD